MDKQCRHATPEKLAEYAAKMASQRATRQAEWEKSKGQDGSARLAGASALDVEGGPKGRHLKQIGRW